MKKLKLTMSLVLMTLTAFAQEEIQQTLKIKSNGVNSTEILMYKQDNSSYFDLYSNDAGFGLYDSNAAAHRLVVNNAGNIGIGTTTPQAKLDVNGQAIINGSGNTLTLKKDNNYPALAFQGQSTVSLIEAGDDYMKAYVGGDTRMAILSNGNIGIGTVTPREKLSVNGKIRAHEIKVETENWPDYVFKPEYKLPTLSAIEKQIKKDGHLPGMPSAKKVEADGLEVSEMLKLQQQKIEELTLYLIEQNKQIEQLLKTVKELKNDHK